MFNNFTSFDKISSTLRGRYFSSVLFTNSNIARLPYFPSDNDWQHSFNILAAAYSANLEIDCRNSNVTSSYNMHQTSNDKLRAVIEHSILNKFLHRRPVTEFCLSLPAFRFSWFIYDWLCFLWYSRRVIIMMIMNVPGLRASTRVIVPFPIFPRWRVVLPPLEWVQERWTVLGARPPRDPPWSQADLYDRTPSGEFVWSPPVMQPTSRRSMIGQHPSRLEDTYSIFRKIRHFSVLKQK